MVAHHLAKPETADAWKIFRVDNAKSSPSQAAGESGLFSYNQLKGGPTNWTVKPIASKALNLPNAAC